MDVKLKLDAFWVIVIGLIHSLGVGMVFTYSNSIVVILQYLRDF